MKAITTSIFLAATAAAACAPLETDAQLAQGLSHEPTTEPQELVRFGGMPELPPSVWQQHIVNGGPENAEPATALLLAFDQNQQVFSICSGTLIAPQRVLTAAHCIDDNVGAAGFGVYFGTDATLENDPGFVFFTEATQVVFHPAWNPNDLEAGNDIGLVFLAQAAPITPIPIRTAPLSSAEIGAPMKLVGWGITGGGREDSGQKRSTTSQLHDFNGNLMQVGDATTGTCSGDSGGPAFMNVGGQIQVAGVTSFGDLDCATTSVDTRVDAFVSFITSDGQDPGNNGGGGGGGNGGGFGASCSSIDECSSGLCAVFEDGTGFCTQQCDGSAGSCPDGFDCIEAEPGLSVCLTDGGPDDDGPSSLPPLRDEGGCSAAGTNSSSSLLLLAVGFLIAAFRRRRRGPQATNRR